MKEIEIAARALQVELHPTGVEARSDFADAFSAMKREHVDALITLAGPGFDVQRSRITGLAAKNRLPAVYPDKTFVEDGGLMSYGRDGAELYRRMASYVDKILKGAKPADLPVEQPTKFEFIVNLKAAKQIGLTIPPNVLVRADKVIK
jgi:putative ABC transport system substrate-binding protein